MQNKAKPTTSISRSSVDKIWIRGADLVGELVGNLTFTEMMLFHLMKKRPTRLQTRVLDAVLVTTMEHGLTPSAISTRLIYHSAPEAMQAAVAAGIMGAGSTYLGTMEGCAALLAEMTSAAEGPEARAAAIVQKYRSTKTFIPGFGHPIHKPDDPRSPKLIEIAEKEGAKGQYIAALRILSAAANQDSPRYLTINATGATAAVLLEIGLDPRIMRGVAIIARTAGLVGHIAEELDNPAAKFIYESVNDLVPYLEP